MNKKESAQTQRQLYDIYCGIIFNAQQFEEGDGTIKYELNCPEYGELLQKYPIERVAGRGGDFERALRVCRWLHPGLKHNSYYDNHIPCNSLALMEYSFNKPEQGINCLNKAKILAECCLALGIYARRMYMMPYSPYDIDNHVVTEIYDRARAKWIMLDPTTGAYIADKDGEPLSLLEARKCAGEGKLMTAVMARQSKKDMKALFERNLAEGYNAYYAKNMAYFGVDMVNKFGKEGGVAYLVPTGLNLKKKMVQTMQYRVDMLTGMNKPELAALFEKRRDDLIKADEPTRISEKTFSAAPTM